eukprot:Hpha_TRINITY_DN15909_c0_g6::TRINITY_DN15909_c0_g6_i2::g.72623::m.72623
MTNHTHTEGLTYSKLGGSRGVLDLVVGPLEPAKHHLHVLPLHGATAPDAQACGGVPVGAHVVRDLLLVEQGEHLLDLVTREIHGEGDGGGRTDLLALAEEVDPLAVCHEVSHRLVVGVGTRDGALQPPDRVDPLEALVVVLHAHHADGVDHVTRAHIVNNLSGKAEDLRQGADGLGLPDALERAGGEHDDTVASLTAEGLLPREGGDVELVPREVHREGGGGGVTDRETLTVRRDPVRVRAADTAGGAVPGEDNVVERVGAAELREAAVARLVRVDVGQLQVLHDVRVPPAPEALEVEDVDRALPQEAPHDHLHS